MKQMLGLQMSIFGSYESIDVDPALVSKLIPVYENKLIPSMIQMAEVDPINSTLRNMNRLSMISPDNKITIAFMPNRVDCNYSFKGEETAPEKIESELNNMCSLLKLTMDYFKLVGNRIAINGRFVTDESSLRYNDYIMKRAFYGDDELNEWSMRSNIIRNLTILGEIELTNNILNIELGKNLQGDSALIVTFDVNTVPGNSIMRFKSDALLPFLDQATQNLTQMLCDLR